MAETTPVTWLTQEAHDRLQSELTHLSGPGRAEITARIDAARQEGDLKENGGYHAAKDEQGKQEARIRQLDHLLRTAQVGAPPATGGIVAPGSVVVAVVGGTEMTFLLGSREVSGTTALDVYSERSPLGAAILGKGPGDTTTYLAPNRREIAVEILSAEPFTG